MTHEVLNQPPPLENYNAYSTDAALTEGVRRECAAWAEPALLTFGARSGSEEVIRWGFEANENPPVLHTHDRFGHRRDEVTFHPSYHRLMELSASAGIHSSPWSDPRQGAHVSRIAHAYLISQAEGAHVCPISMTYSSVPALRKQADLAQIWEPLITRQAYDPSFAPAPTKKGALIGMGMTEKQGGSDVRANTTTAELQRDGSYRITGHKWFCSAPMCDGFLVLAQAKQGLSCLFVPRWTPDGVKNRFFLQRLKNKLGNRANASSEVEFDAAWAHAIGEPGRGVPTIIEMVNHTRLDCVMGSAAIMRQALVQAIHHCRHRRAFGALLIDQPLMQAVLADLVLESEAATVLMLRLARAYDEGDRLFARLATAVAKYWISKRAALFVGEALECLGGAGYVEESIMPRLYREAPLNSIWEGSGSVIALDVMRAIHKEPESLEAVMREIHLVPEMGRAASRVVDRMHEHADDPGFPRLLTETLAVTLEGSLLRCFSTQEIADAFTETRVDRKHGHTLGTLPRGVACREIIDRAWA
ncbi:MAG TPA: acyl-CoA dehydrogenase family protein [Bryobacteraceae bacterium]|jgi:putative acyl-CoA dehydrogenase